MSIIVEEEEHLYQNLFVDRSRESSPVSFTYPIAPLGAMSSEGECPDADSSDLVSLATLAECSGSHYQYNKENESGENRGAGSTLAYHRGGLDTAPKPQDPHSDDNLSQLSDHFGQACQRRSRSRPLRQPPCTAFLSFCSHILVAHRNPRLWKVFEHDGHTDVRNS